MTKLTKPIYCKVKGIKGVLEVVSYEHMRDTLVTFVVRATEYPYEQYRVDSHHVTIIDENETKEEEVGIIDSFENMTIEGEFYVEKAGDVMTIRVKNGKMSICKGE